MLTITMVALPNRPRTLEDNVPSPRSVLHCTEDVLRCLEKVEPAELPVGSSWPRTTSRKRLNHDSMVTPAHAYRSVDLLPPRALTKKARVLHLGAFGWEPCRFSGRPSQYTFAGINRMLSTHVDARKLAWDGVPMLCNIRIP